jgi:hypothetical protein
MVLFMIIAIETINNVAYCIFINQREIITFVILDLFCKYTMIDQKDIDNVFVKYVKEYQGTL